MDGQIILEAQALEGLLHDSDKKNVGQLENLYHQAMNLFQNLSDDDSKAKEKVIDLFHKMGDAMQKALADTPQIKVYCFNTPKLLHGEASRVIAKLRDTRTGHEEFVYYTQRAYEMLFNLAYGSDEPGSKNHLIVKTPVNHPVQNFAVHRIPDVDEEIGNSVMCVMLRGALLPSMILSKEIQENSSTGYVTPFALFRIKRNDHRGETDMEYILDLKKSFFNLEDLQGKDLIFADPMNATAGSLVTIVKYLKSQGVKPRSIKFFNVISSFKGALHALRALPQEVSLYTLWMDPVLNEKAYIMPGLGDAGDRLNGRDTEELPRNMIQLLADYGSGINSLYRSQVRQIEKTVLAD